MDLPEKILKAISGVLGSKSCGLHEPNFDGNEQAYLQACLESTYVSSIGKFVDQFEAGLVDLTGSKYAVAMVNGTSALHLALKIAGVTRNDEVLMPALTFAATANAVAYCGAIPHFTDSEEVTLGINVAKLRDYLETNSFRRENLCINKNSGRVIRALICMHVFGHASDIEGLLGISKDFNIPLIEDAAESIGTLYNGKHTGTFGVMGVLSFNGNKTITTGGGGALLTNDKKLAETARHLSTTAKVPHEWEFIHDQVGYNYRMPNINAALGCAQLERLTSKISAKKMLYENYRSAFKDISGIKLMSAPQKSQSNYWLQTLLLDSSNTFLRDEILSLTNSSGYMTRPVWRLLHELAPYIECPRMDLSEAEILQGRIINIPSSPTLGVES